MTSRLCVTNWVSGIFSSVSFPSLLSLFLTACGNRRGQQVPQMRTLWEALREAAARL